MYILHIGYSGFPSGHASTQRILLIFKAIKASGLNPLIINKHSVSISDNGNNINLFQGLPYINCSFSKTRHDSFIIRNLNKLTGYIGELNLFIKKNKKIHSVIYYDSSILELIYYRVLSKIFKFKLIIQYVELRSALPQRQSGLVHVNDLLFDRFCFYFCDGIIAISEYLKNNSSKYKKSLPILKVPAICDFDEFDEKSSYPSGSFLMFCGSIAYLSIIEFILDLYFVLREANLYNGGLVLVIGCGEKDQLNFKILQEKINRNKYVNDISIEKNIPRNQLIQYYLNAEILVIPLRNSLQDIARFSHKVGEYTATGRPIISTNIGELKHYFKDGVSAILADDYSIDSYLLKLKEIFESKDKDLLFKIGAEGYQVGIRKLNYKMYATELRDFLLNL